MKLVNVRVKIIIRAKKIIFGIFEIVSIEKALVMIQKLRLMKL